ncbi:MAG: HlyC/CorC family transporter [Gammaproteobacteria bacterium]|nr:HlyC/CorC family transporter [Gammaproteobacteria bacterium]
MNDIPLSALFGALVLLILLAAFFSGSETGLLTLNRYRLRHLVNIKHRGAMHAQALLQRTDRLIGLLILGNNFANNLATAVATIIGLQLLGDVGAAVAVALLTIAGTIFTDVAPKTLGALYSERVAFPAAYVLRPLLKLFYPVVWLVSTLSNGVLRLLGISIEAGERNHLSHEELRTVVNEAGALIPRRHQKMLLSILDLEKVTVEDIMIPRNEIAGIDLNDEWDDIVNQITSSQHTRLVVHRGGVENVIGLLHLRDALHLLARGEFNKEALVNVTQEPYFVPLGSPLNTQMLNFQRQKQRVGLVVNEYGDIQGLVTLADILEEIVGEFTTDPSASIKEIRRQDDGTYLVDGGVNIRDLNRVLRWQLPTDGPKTLNGLILDYLEAIPEPGTSLCIADYMIEIIQTTANAVKTLKIGALPGTESREEEKPAEQ